MLRLLFGRASSGKTSYMFDEMNRAIRNGETGLYMLVPEQYSHSAERMLCEYCGNSVSLHGEVLTFSRLAMRILGETGCASLRVINNAGRVLIMSRALKTVVPELRVFGKHAGSADFVQKLIETASEVKNSCLTPDDIRKCAETAEYPLSDKLSDLALILDVYRSLFDAAHIDPDDLLEKASERLKDSVFATGIKMLIDGFADFSVRQQEMIKTLLMHGADITVSLTCNDMSGLSDVFSTTRETAARLISMAGRIGTQVRTVRLGSPLEASRQTAFEQIISGENAEPMENGGFVSLYCADDPAQECELAASKAIELVRGGMRWQDISVVTGAWDAYRAIGRSIFEKYSVPVYTNEKVDILTLPPVAYISSALMTILSGWEYSSVFRCLKTGLCNITREETDILENYVLKWNIRGRLWYQPEPWTFSPSGFGEMSPEEEAELSAINDIRLRVAEPISKLQEELKNALTVREKLTALYAFLEKTDFPKKLQEKSDIYDRAGNTQLARTYTQIWDAVLDAMEQFCDAAGDEQYDLQEFLSFWELALSQYNIGTIPTVLDRIGFGDYERVRRRGTRCLIVIGATEDCFPHLASSPGIFSDFERDALIKNGLSLRLSTDAAIAGDLFALYSSLTLPSEKLIISYPKSDLTGSEKRPAPIIRQISRCFSADIERIDLPACRENAPAPCFELALCDGDSAAYKLLSEDHELSEKLMLFREAIKMRRGKMTPLAAKRLYGNEIRTSASNVEKYYSCRYSFFLRYGLKLKPRTKAELDSRTIGLFMHYVLENTTREIRSLGGFSAVNDEACTELTKKNIEKYAEAVLGGLSDKSGRFRYLFDRLSADAVSVMLNMAEELRSSDFEPLDFELSISDGGDIPAPRITDGETSLSLTGVVDRVDGWLHDGKLYLRVIDYKTGNKEFSMSDVWNGLGLQMLIYLFTLCENAAEHYGKKIEPAGILYVPAHDAFVSVPRNADDAAIEKKRAGKILRSGLILDDIDTINAMENGDTKKYIPVKLSRNGTFGGDALITAERFGKLYEHIRHTLLQLARELKSGVLAADPFYRSQQQDACTYCDFRHECAFGDYSDDKKRCITNLKAPEFWERIESEASR